MSSSLQGRRALVTGGTRGIGRAIAASLLREGCRVLICGTKAETTQEAETALSALGPVFSQTADVSSPEQVKGLFSFADREMGGLDLLVNNAGIGIFRSVSELSYEDWEKVLRVNLSGVYYCSHEALPRLRQAGGGDIINISSLAGKNAFAGGAAYNASKFGLNGFSEAMMLDHRYDNVRVTAILPGSVNTEFGGGGQDDEWKIAPEDVADVVLAVLRMPARTTVSRVEIRPSRPKGKS